MCTSIWNVAAIEVVDNLQLHSLALSDHVDMRPYRELPSCTLDWIGSVSSEFRDREKSESDATRNRR